MVTRLELTVNTGPAVAVIVVTRGQTPIMVSLSLPAGMVTDSLKVPVKILMVSPGAEAAMAALMVANCSGTTRTVNLLSSFLKIVKCWLVYSMQVSTFCAKLFQHKRQDCLYPVLLAKVPIFHIKL